MISTLFIINKYMSKKNDSQLIWESYVTEGEGSNDYMSYLKQIAQQTGDQHPDATSEPQGHLENVLSHPFEETYAEYLRSKGVTPPLEAAQLHIKAAEQMGAYHEVDLNALQNWQHT